MSASQHPDAKSHTAALSCKTSVRSGESDAAVQLELLPTTSLPSCSPNLGADASNPTVKPLQSQPCKRRREDGASDDATDEVSTKSERPEGTVYSASSRLQTCETNSDQMLPLIIEVMGAFLMLTLCKLGHVSVAVEMMA